MKTNALTYLLAIFLQCNFTGALLSVDEEITPGFVLESQAKILALLRDEDYQFESSELEKNNKVESKSDTPWAYRAILSQNGNNLLALLQKFSDKNTKARMRASLWDGEKAYYAITTPLGRNFMITKSFSPQPRIFLRDILIPEDIILISNPGLITEDPWTTYNPQMEAFQILTLPYRFSKNDKGEFVNKRFTRWDLITNKSVRDALDQMLSVKEITDSEVVFELSEAISSKWPFQHYQFYYEAVSSNSGTWWRIKKIIRGFYWTVCIGEPMQLSRDNAKEAKNGYDELTFLYSENVASWRSIIPKIVNISSFQDGKVLWSVSSRLINDEVGPGLVQDGAMNLIQVANDVEEVGK